MEYEVVDHGHFGETWGIEKGIVMGRPDDPAKKQPWVWEKIPGHERNEALDCRNYALAAFKCTLAYLDEIEGG